MVLNVLLVRNECFQTRCRGLADIGIGRECRVVGNEILDVVMEVGNAELNLLQHRLLETEIIAEA